MSFNANMVRISRLCLALFLGNRSFLLHLFWTHPLVLLTKHQLAVNKCWSAYGFFSGKHFCYYLAISPKKFNSQWNTGGRLQSAVVRFKDSKLIFVFLHLSSLYFLLNRGNESHRRNHIITSCIQSKKNHN